MNRKLLILSALFAVCCWLSCRVDPAVPLSSNQLMNQVAFNIPKGWPTPYYQFVNNPLTNDGFQLGRRIFYDARISSDGTVSCGVCHQNFAAFANLDHTFSHGVGGLFGTRNTPGIFNMAWNTSYFWDGGVVNLENQPINPMTNAVEMNETLPDVISKLTKDALYPGMFKKAFSDGQVTSQHIFQALAQFMAVMISNNSKYDKYTRGEAGLTTQELHGLTLFKDSCAGCHKEPLFSDYKFRNIGLMPGVLNDSGRGHITHNVADLYKFKTPSLRNVALTAPYMHDGRFNTLLDVLNYMDTGIIPGAKQNANLDSTIANGIHLTAMEKNDMISFLNTLSDSTMNYNPLFLSPNNYPAK
jgi:cytochrome c peroxidase